MQDFQLHRPGTVAEAADLLGDGVKLLAGGQSLLPLMKLDLAEPSGLVTLAGIPELREIRREGDVLTIGAAATHATVGDSADVQTAIPALAALACGIGDAQVRNRGTLGGSIAHADPVADYPAALLALDATVETHQRAIAADAFFTGIFETSLEAGEIVTAVRFPIPERAAYAKFPNPASKFAIVGVFVARHGDDTVRVAVTGAAPSVFRVAVMEAALAGDFAASALDGISVQRDDWLDDTDASAEYRAHLVSVMARRAVEHAA